MTATRPDVAGFLSTLTPVAAYECVWPAGIELAISAYVTEALPPADLVSSVRSLLVRGDSVMVMTSKDGSRHVLPGGRCEADESFDETLRRELEEETGWRGATRGPIGFLRLHHLSPRPPGFRYPYPDSFQLVFLSEATDEVPGSRAIEDEWEEEARFVPLADVLDMELAPTDRALLEAGLASR